VRESPFCRLFFACRLSRECSLWGRRLRPTDSCMCGGRRTARPRSTPISGPRAACAAALEERAGAHLTVRVHERARRAVRASCPCQVEVGLARWRPFFCLHDAGCCTHLVTRPLLGNQLARKISLVWRRGTGRRNEVRVFAKELTERAKLSPREAIATRKRNRFSGRRALPACPSFPRAKACDQRHLWDRHPT
jgi:hypothetical protein